MLHRLRVYVEQVGVEVGKKTSPHGPVVRSDVAEPIRLDGTVAENQVHADRLDALDSGDVLGVLGKLYEGGRLGGSSELRVVDLIGE